MRTIKSFALSILFLTISGASITFSQTPPPLPNICTPSIEPSFVIQVIDSVTRQPIEARVEVQSGNFRVVLPRSGSGAYTGPDERPGVYKITVSREGYRTYTAQGVGVVMDSERCHVVTRHIKVELTPVPIRRPVLSSITPQSGPFKTRITLRGSGFDRARNLIYFDSGVVAVVPSADGRTIVFKLPDSSCPACTFSTPACAAPCRSLNPGKYSVSVQNSLGRSGSLPFTITERSTGNDCSQEQNAIIAAYSNPQVTACILSAQEPGFQITPQITVTGSCIAGGFIRHIDFFKAPKCKDTPERPCPRPMAVLVASLDLDCENNVINAKCHRQNSPGISSCLPEGITLEDVVSAEMIEFGEKGPVIKTVTVKDKLTELGAGCQNGKLVDSKGREIYFYKLTGCWGNPPDNYHEILERQAKELAELRSKYTVIEMTCNPSGIPVP
jgi:hypothetical protein